MIEIVCNGLTYNRDATVPTAEFFGCRRYLGGVDAGDHNKDRQ